MPEWLQNIDWKFLIGDLVVPIGLFVLGFLLARVWNVESIRPNQKSRVIVTLSSRTVVFTNKRWVCVWQQRSK